MKKEMTINRKVATVLILAGLLFGAMFAGAMTFMGSPVMAQAGGEAEDETNDADDANEGADVPITGDALEQASNAALDYIGEGRVTETEVGDEEGYYEVEITRDNGSQVDVHLDEAFNILGHEND